MTSDKKHTYYTGLNWFRFLVGFGFVTNMHLDRAKGTPVSYKKIGIEVRNLLCSSVNHRLCR